jgi:iron(III) transport system ATP-binding protein
LAVAVRIEALTKSFAGQKVVDRVSVDIAPGEVFFLLGPSGCGKTTLLRCIAGFYVPDAGRILIGDRDVTHLPPEERDTGMVFQSYALWPHLTAAENVAFGLELRKIPREEIRRRVDEALATVRMTERSDYKPNQLSGGQQQRIALARALVVHPACLLLDEPLSNLDARLRLEMRTEIRRICKQAGLTAIYVTHDQKEALSIADRLAVLDRGAIQQCGSPREVYLRPRTRLVANFIGETNFVEGTVQRMRNGATEVATPVGTVRSTVPPPEPVAEGAAVTLSIRPEVIHIDTAPPADAGNVFDGAVHDSIYQGETAQHLVNVPPPAPGRADGLAWKVIDLNPKIVAQDADVRMTKVWFRPANVVMLTR